MSGYLLDTHTLIWFLDDDSRLPIAVRKIIEHEEAIYIPSISLFEIAIKVNIGKLVISSSLSELKEKCIKLHLNIVDFDSRELDRYLTLPIYHRDPFDRLIIAMAIERGYYLISKDKIFDSYNVSRFW